jgi:hypothetical protein
MGWGFIPSVEETTTSPQNSKKCNFRNKKTKMLKKVFLFTVTAIISFLSFSF